MTWQSVGTHSFVPTDKAVQVGSFDLAAGQDTIWVRITQLNPVDDWPWSYGILSWRNANGTPLGSIKAYSNRLGEVFRLGNGLPPSDGTGSIWFEPRGFNLGWLKAGFPWELQFEAQAGTSDVTSGYWNRDPNNDLITPRTRGDNLDMTPGWIKAKNLIITDGTGTTEDRDVPGFQQGTWVPSVDFGTVNQNPNSNYWSRVGNIVTVYSWLSGFTDNSTASSLNCQGLPYPFAFNQVAGSCMSSNTSVAADTTFLSTSAGGVLFYKSSGSLSDSWDSLVYSGTNSASQIRFHVSYMTDDITWLPQNNATVS